VQTAIALLSQLSRPRRRISSYSIKHATESWGLRHGLRSYVSNGALLVGAVELGLAIKPYGPDCPNCMVGVARWSVAAVP
jgi:hypothetical protein